MKKIVLAALASACLALTIAPASAAGCYSEGIRVGTVQKISKKGRFSPSWEGELVLPGMRAVADGRTNTNIWRFSTLKADVAASIEEAAMTGASVALKYCQRDPIIPRLDIDTEYEIVKAVARNN